VLRRLGVRLFQGFLFARPGTAVLPDVAWDAA
jgi:EAL domain-containing protein (putative c-di-GMP-specific phosphodiesterase class I)